MQHFDTIIANLIHKHKDPQTLYGPTQMFDSANDLSFAISRLLDAQRIFTDDTFENKAMTDELSELWFSIRDEMPSETASDLALCIIKNTPFSNTQEQTEKVKELFYKTMYSFSENADLSKAFIEVFFGEVEAKMPRMRGQG